MSPDERFAFLGEVWDALSDPLVAMGEGRPHKKAKSKAIDMLGLHFRAMGRRIYLAEEMSVLYPGAQAFCPDIFAVLDVDDPEDDERMAWVVADEGKGLDWVLEVVFGGDRKKDLVDNVERYASLAIPEYFVYDRRDQRIHGYRLSASRRYQPILPQAGLYRSAVLGVDIAIVEGSLRFYQGTAELYDTVHLIRRLEGMVENLGAQAESAARHAEKATRDAERVLASMRHAITSVLASRGLTCSDENRVNLEACTDPDILDQWHSRALVAKSVADVFQT